MDDDLVVGSIMLCTSFSTYNLVLLKKKKSTYDLVSHWFLNWIFGILLLSLLIVSIIIWNMTILYNQIRSLINVIYFITLFLDLCLRVFVMYNYSYYMFQGLLSLDMKQ